MKFEECIGEYSMVFFFRNLEDGFEWAFAGVYRPNLDSSRRLMWDDIAGVYS